MLSLEDLKQDVANGSIDTVVVAFTDMQGRLLGKRVHARYFLDEGIAEHGVEGCNYLLALDMEMDPHPGYSIASWEQGYGDFATAPDLETLRRIPWLEGTALVLCDVDWEDGSPVRRLAAAGAEGAGRTRSRVGLRADDRLRARVLLAQGELRGSACEALPRPDPVSAVHPRLPRARDHVRRAAAPSDPQRHARRGHRGRELEGRGLAWPAGDQLPLRRRADDGRQPRDLQERRQGDRAPERLLDHVHGEARPLVDRQLVPHPCEPLARRRERLRGEREVFERFLAGWIAASKELALFLAPTINSYKRYAAGRGRRRRSPGGTTTAPAASGSSVTGRRSGSRPASPAATSIRTWRLPR